jgi:hypothetical protein
MDPCDNSKVMFTPARSQSSRKVMVHTSNVESIAFMHAPQKVQDGYFITTSFLTELNIFDPS